MPTAMAVPGRSILSSVYMRQTLLSEFRSGWRFIDPKLRVLPTRC